ncbi:MAG: hypothetical protein ACI9VI_002352, partial [Candidatus Azotimanducaceae bacterium]
RKVCRWVDQDASQLSLVWIDPEFDSSHPAFYDRIALDKQSGDDYPDVIQERVYTISPG